MMWDGGDWIITLSPSKKTALIVLLFTVVALATQMMPAHAVADYSITFVSTTVTTQAGYYVYLTATLGNNNNAPWNWPPSTIKFTINGIQFINVDGIGNVWKAHVYSGNMDVLTLDTIDSFTSPSEPGASASLTNSEIVTWTQNPADVLSGYTVVGDLTGMFWYFATYQLGVTMTMTIFMGAVSLAIYNYQGPEPTLLFWLLGWGVFSGFMYGGAQAFGILILVVGGGALFTQVIMGRRDRY